MKGSGREPITQERLKELLRYDPNTGEFEYLKSRKRAQKGHRTHGVDNGHGYKVITIDYKSYRAHRLAWLYMTGEHTDLLDHIDGDRSNNRFVNLRKCTTSQNAANKKRAINNTTGLKGVFIGNGKYRAAIKKDGKRVYLGSYRTPEEAHQAYVDAATLMFGEFARAS